MGKAGTLKRMVKCKCSTL